MKYEVDVSEMQYGYIVVDANSEEEAREAAENAYYDGETIWQDSDGPNFGEITVQEEIPSDIKQSMFI